jgi:PAS domain S-box-containing protein
MTNLAAPSEPSAPVQVFLDERILDLPDRLLDLLPIGVYVCDRDGLIVRYNRVAGELWGTSPNIGDPSARYCGSYRLYGMDGKYLPHAKCPMADVLASGTGLRDQEVAIERPDGTRIVALVNIEPIRGDSGGVIGAVNVFRERPEPRSDQDHLDGVYAAESRLRESEARYRTLAAVVESSEDAIVTKDLDAVITSWNRAAQRLFGYAAEEAIGKPITLLIPKDRLNEEPAILERIRRGERVEHFDTIRRRKDGTLIDISLTISPLRNPEGKIIGASKIAREITERRRAEDQQRLLLREMDHRVKNLFALASGVVALSARSATTPKGLSLAVQERLSALARAHALTLRPFAENNQSPQKPTTLHALIATILSPHDGETDDGAPRVVIRGPDIPIGGGSVMSLALLLHELATNAVKYGALSSSAGAVAIECAEDDGRFALTWTERGGPPVAGRAESEGFGAQLIRATIKDQLGGEISRDWNPEGLTIRLSFAKDRVVAS